MRSKLPVGFLFLISIVFIGFGDQFLPSEIGRYSFQARSSIDTIVGEYCPESATEDESVSPY